MADRWAMVRNGVVVNVCTWDGDLGKWEPPADVLMVATDDAGYGYLYDEIAKIFTQPDIAVPVQGPLDKLVDLMVAQGIISLAQADEVKKP